MWSPSQIAEKREAKRKSGAFLFLNLWPFAAILMFLLLIFLSNHIPIDFPHRPPSDLPKSSYAALQVGARREDAIRITVTRDGAVYLGQTAMRLQELGPAVQNAVREGADKKVYISADARAKSIDVERVVDELGRAGITQISFLTAQQ
jgi:biopolymer transport protein TolR